ncbi:MAG: hypothetical protein H6551_03140 [Chitinophagales bacterium]|nr:hypothetical protein [Chitinophagales bacterium]
MQLTLIKLLHTVIWVLMVGIIFHVVWSGVTGNINIYSWISVGVVILEGIVLLIFGGSCPLTVVARKYSDSTKHNFDIYLPEWLAKYNKHIFTTVFLLGLILMLYHSFDTSPKC